jgi:hypothetical protein
MLTAAQPTTAQSINLGGFQHLTAFVVKQMIEYPKLVLVHVGQAVFQPGSDLVKHATNFANGHGFIDFRPIIEINHGLPQTVIPIDHAIRVLDDGPAIPISRVPYMDLVLSSAIIVLPGAQGRFLSIELTTYYADKRFTMVFESGLVQNRSTHKRQLSHFVLLDERLGCSRACH